MIFLPTDTKTTACMQVANKKTNKNRWINQNQLINIKNLGWKLKTISDNGLINLQQIHV